MTAKKSRKFWTHKDWHYCRNGLHKFMLVKKSLAESYYGKTNVVRVKIEEVSNG